MEDRHFEQLLEELRELSSQTVRDIAVLDTDELVDFVERREEIVVAMKPYLALMSDAAKEIIKQMLVDERVILDRMYQLKNEAGEWLQNLGNVRVQQNAYQQSYSIDSLFIDHRK
ncbi:hypothetical protein [Paenibacillus sp. S150]|uniref:hypothetical protein n=1 Tax=Paenibacillus sp. S150 TaxID=2749826 RepID=UPI001C58E906|nr:hypothetical protein [Paenibacillus sp. S150]MBW4081661.1 hypothetical protein [Paenibacillus sp. S150]